MLNFFRTGQGGCVPCGKLSADPRCSYGEIQTMSYIPNLWVSRTGSASDWCALQEALYKCIDTIQYNNNSLSWWSDSLTFS